jgi:hypothetical protein
LACQYASFGILTAPKNTELATKSATILYEINQKLWFISKISNGESKKCVGEIFICILDAYV